LKLNGTNQLLSYADKVNVLGKNTEVLSEARKEVGWIKSKHRENEVYGCVSPPKCRTKSQFTDI
jgi:hypothetical protein